MLNKIIYQNKNENRIHVDEYYSLEQNDPKDTDFVFSSIGIHNIHTAIRAPISRICPMMIQK
jgi:hypothetical protein